MALFLILLLAGCGPARSDSQVEEDARALAEIYCKAQMLRAERFQLADEIRFLEDSIMMFPDAPETKNRELALQELQATTTSMWQRTKSVADSINRLLDSFYKGNYPEKADRSRLDKELEKVMRDVCDVNPASDLLK